MSGQPFSQQTSFPSLDLFAALFVEDDNGVNSLDSTAIEDDQGRFLDTRVSLEIALHGGQRESLLANLDDAIRASE
jgi:hypothetical protein